MRDPYLYPDVDVLRNKLNVKTEKTLDLIEAEQSRMNMMLLYDRGFSNFTPDGLREIHRFLFGDIYDWAGEYRVINIQKREILLGGRSVWYTNVGHIENALSNAFDALNRFDWCGCSREYFVSALARRFSSIWQIHPFREGNTRTVVMLMTLFVESHGYFFDKDLLAASAGYVRNSFVMASIDQNSEYEHLERILLDAVCTEPVSEDSETEPLSDDKTEKYQKYQKEPYRPTPHTLVDE